MNLTMQKIFKDQLGNEVRISFPPKRIISLVPSQTEFLFDLGLEEQIVGITKYCIHPKEGCKGKVKVGGTKKLDLIKIGELSPDLIIANKEENTKEEIEVLQGMFPVWISNIQDLNEALDMMKVVGEITGRASEALTIAGAIRERFSELYLKSNFSVAYFIWRKPYMTVGADTFIHNMLSCSGFENVFKDRFRYPVVNTDEIKKTQPDYIFLSSEPYPFREKHLKEFKSICPESKVVLVDGEYFSWYGSRLLGAVDYFKNLLLKIN